MKKIVAIGAVIVAAIASVTTFNLRNGFLKGAAMMKSMRSVKRCASCGII